jgi:hypothetical protein
MSTPAAESRCNRCQTPIPVDAPVPFCPPCIAAGALRQGPEGPDDEDRSRPNWPAIGLAVGILAVLAILIFQTAQQEAATQSNTATNSPSQTNPPPSPNLPTP